MAVNTAERPRMSDAQRRAISERMHGNANGRGNLGGTRTPEQRQRMREARKTGSERRNPSLSYTAIHKRLRRERGTPALCEHCGTTAAKKFEWAYTGPGHDSVPGSYGTNLDDYIRLCTSCHLAFDNTTARRSRGGR